MVNIDNRILSVIKSMKSNLTKAEKRIAEVILEDPDKIVYISTAELSKLSNVGEASIVRFCKKLGFLGFQNFKMELAKELSVTKNKSKELLSIAISNGEVAGSIAEKYRSSINKALEETIKLNEFNLIKECVDALKKSNKIFIFGVGNSGVTAMDAKFKFMRIGLDVDAMDNNHLMIMKASLLKKGDMAIGISNSGNTNDTVYTMKIAKESGATTLSITHSLNSKIVGYSDFCLINGSTDDELCQDSIETKTSQLLLIELLYSLLIKSSGEKVKINKEKTLRAIKGRNF